MTPTDDPAKKLDVVKFSDIKNSVAEEMKKLFLRDGGHPWPALTPGDPRFPEHMKWLEGRVREEAAVPEAMAVSPMRQSGKALELAEQYRREQNQQAALAGLKMDFLTIDEARDSMLNGNWKVESSVFDTKHDDRADALAYGSLDMRGKPLTPGDLMNARASVYGLTRHSGEKDDSFRSRIQAMLKGEPRSTQAGIIGALMGINGVLDVNIVEKEGATVDVRFKLEPGADHDFVGDKVREVVEFMRPAGVKVDLTVDVNGEVTEKYEETEEERFLKRLRSKLQDLYPPDED